MANTGNLKGIRCPNCGNEDRFAVDADQSLFVRDGDIEAFGRAGWNEDSGTSCRNCGWKGMWSDFRVLEESELIPYDRMATLLAYDAGEIGDSRIIELFQDLVDTGLAWQLDSDYSRNAKALMEAGWVKPSDFSDLRQPPSRVVLPELDRGDWSSLEWDDADGWGGGKWGFG